MTMLPAGTRVSFAYECRDENGMMLESLRRDTPATLTLGQHELLPPLEAALAEMQAGESRQVVLAPDEAFGPRLDELVGLVPHDVLPDEPAPILGDVLELQTEGEEEPMAVLVTSVEEDGCVVDANHPMAGKELHYELYLVAILD
ncbi:MAG: hypothetical protein HN904_22730 [Victivallales bacterium]|jgi:peptidylprolyl isomerase|nr:hypothetical protein [Victivallales bacterium]MBT7165611.1 hypothetical protein [Victivallales bacterium]